MKLLVRHERVRLYLRIGAAFLLLGVIGDLLYDVASVGPKAVNHAWMLTYLTTLNYLLYDHLLPAVRLTWKRLLLGFVLVWVLIGLCSFGLNAWRMMGIRLQLYTDFAAYKTSSDALRAQMGYSVGSLFFFGIIRYTYDFRRLTETAQQLRIEKQAAELNYLKSQTNPHFLFNTLNNIYVLSREKSEMAPEAILRLSELLRYMLYETGGRHVALDKEVTIITNYLALERLRYDDTLRVTFTTDIDNPGQPLPPLLLMPLVENAFKHGTAETRQLPFVDIRLAVRQHRLLFVIRNSIDRSTDVPITERIGLTNLRRQLELLFTDYHLRLVREGPVFVTTLTINLTSHV